MKIKFFLTSSNRSPVEEFLSELPSATRSEFLDAVALLADGANLSMPLSRNLSSIRPGLHELRFRDRAGHVRVFYFIKKAEAIYFVHAMRKKTQEILKKDIELILKRIGDI